MNNNRKWFAIFVCVFMLFGFAGCEKEKRGPVDVTAEKGKDVVKAVVGSEGGSIGFGAGGAKLTIPAKLLQEDVTLTIERVEPSLDLPGKDVVGKAYRIYPRLTFAPGAARVYIPVDRVLPGLPNDINLKMYVYDRLESEGPEGPTFVHKWQVHQTIKFTGYSPDQKHLMFDLYETISDKSTKPPFGLLQAAYNTK
jgi:hypothetical protein